MKLQDDITEAEKRIYATQPSGIVSDQDMAVYLKKKGILGNPHHIPIPRLKTANQMGSPPYDFVESDIDFFKVDGGYQRNG